MGSSKIGFWTVKQTIFDSLMIAYLFCVTVMVIANPSSEQLLNLKLNALVFVGGIAIGVVVSSLANRVRTHGAAVVQASGSTVQGFSFKTLGKSLFEPAHFKTHAVHFPWHRTFGGWQLLIFLVVTFVVGVNLTKFSFIELMDEKGFHGAMRLFSALSSPNWDLLPKAVLKIIETVFMAFMATALAIPIAFVVCFLAAKNIMVHPAAFVVYTLLRTTMNVARSIEALIWAIIFSVWVGIGPFAGMLALMIHSIASLTKQYSEIVETVDEGPIEGIKSTGANLIQTIWFAIVPQVILPFVSFTVYRWDINIRMATIIGLVGGGGIGTLLQLYQGQAMWNEVGTIILVIAFVVWFMDTASAYLREALK